MFQVQTFGICNSILVWSVLCKRSASGKKYTSYLISWRLEQEQYWNHIRTRKSSKRWTSELIKKLWDVAWDLWDQRNEALHNTTESRDILNSYADDQIKNVYQQGSTTLPRDALHLIREPLEVQLTKSLATKQLWLQSIQAAQDRKKRHEHGAMAGKQ